MDRNLLKIPGTNLQRGSALIAVIAAIAIFSVLAAALLSMTSTFGRQTAHLHLADKAYFIAESGYRLAASYYRYPPSAYPDPNDALENLDLIGSATIDDNDGRFNLKIFSYFYELTANAQTGDTTLYVRTPGNYPGDEITTLADQKVYIQGNTYTLTSGSGLIAASEDHLFLTITPGLHETIGAKTLIYPLSAAGTGSPWNGSDRSLGFQPGQATMFPQRNGRIRVAGRTLVYRLKDETNNAFTDIRDIHGDNISGFTIPSNATILLLPYIRVDATGIIGEDDILTRRKISYYGALPAAFSETYAEKFNDPDSILATPRGTHDIGTVEGTNPVLKITGGDAQGLFLSQLDVGETGDEKANAAREGFNDFRSSSGGYLSYDAQTKVGFYSSLGFHPNFIEHSDLAAGLSFRINSENVNGATYENMYGLSFLHNEESTIPTDIIPDGIPPNEPAIILWQQTIDPSAADPIKRTWLAYKKVHTLFYEDFSDELDSEIWTDEGTWTLSDQALFIEAFVPYEDSIYLTITLPDCICSNNLLMFDSTFGDLAIARQVKIYKDGNTTPYITEDVSEGSFNLPLPQELGTQIIIEFYFRNLRDYGSWEIDNLRIIDESSIPVHNSTLLVRLKEGAAIPFNYTGAATMETGDRVVGVDSGTIGRVISPPMIQTGPPDGYVLLNSLSEASWFNANETLNVLGKGNIATVSGAPDQGTLRKANVIKVYYASEAGCTQSVPDPSTPLDCYTLPYERREGYQTLQWPVNDGVQWTADRDYFRLIQWDAVNLTIDGSDTNFGLVLPLPNTYGVNDVDRTIILSHQENLQSPDLGETFNQPELGLHAMGSDAVDHVYFDDFGFRIYYSPDSLFPTPLQQ